MRGSYVIYYALTLLVILSSGLLVSMMRYDLDIFPFFLSLALMTRRGRLGNRSPPCSHVSPGFSWLFSLCDAGWRNDYLR